MASIFINDIQGTGIYAVPSNAAASATAKAGLAALLSGVANFTFKRTLLPISSNKSGTPYRRMNMFVDGISYLTKECPSAAETAAMLAAIEAALVADANITAIGTIDVSLFPAIDNSLWTLDYGSGSVTLFSPSDAVSGGAVYSGTQILSSAAMPVPWTDLDLSAYVGSNVARVWLVFTATANNSRIAVRRKGDTNDYRQLTLSTPNMQHTGIISASGTSAPITCMTDLNGVIQYIGAGQGDVTLNDYAVA